MGAASRDRRLRHGGQLIVSINPASLPAPAPVAQAAAAPLDPVMVRLNESLAYRYAQFAAVSEACKPGSQAAVRAEMLQVLTTAPDSFIRESALRQNIRRGVTERATRRSIQMWRTPAVRGLTRMLAIKRKLSSRRTWNICKANNAANYSTRGLTQAERHGNQDAVENSEAIFDSCIAEDPVKPGSTLRFSVCGPARRHYPHRLVRLLEERMPRFSRMLNRVPNRPAAIALFNGNFYEGLQHARNS